MQVNYVREHERFIEYAADERVPANVQLLWYALMHIFNQRADGSEWPDGFIRITNDRLFTYLPIKWDAMARARNALKQMGRIDFRNGNRNRTAPEYRIIPFYPSCYPFKTDNTGGNMGGNTGGNMGGNPGDIYININRDINKRDEEDDDEDDRYARAREDAAGEADGDDPDPRERGDRIRSAFRGAVGRTPTPTETERLAAGADRMGFGTEMICLAIGRAAGAGASSPADYALAILGEWRRNEVMQPHQIDEYLAEYAAENGKYGLHGSGDAAADYRDRRAARERRRQENLSAGIA